MSDVTAAHVQRVTEHIVEWYPDHEPRTSDPHYAVFNAARAKLKAAGKLICWVCGKDAAGAGAPIELHHSKVEFSLQNGVDIGKFETEYPDLDITDEDSFFNFVEGEGNLTALCIKHHRGTEGIHCVPYPNWQMLRVWKDGLPDPVQLDSTTVKVDGAAVVTVTQPDPDKSVEVTAATSGAPG